VRRGQRRLPVAAFLELAVTGEDERAPRSAVHLGAQRAANGDGQAMSEGSGVGLDTWHFRPIGMAAEISRRFPPSSCATVTAGGRRSARRKKLQRDPHFRDHLLFHEYFDGDDGSGVGASHQTGWTGLVAKLLQQSGD